MYPEHVAIEAFEFNGLLNDILARLHETDMVVKNLRSQIQLIDQNAFATLRNFLKFALKEPKTLDDLSGIVGVQKEQLKPFLDKMIEENLLTVSEDKYSWMSS